MFHVMGATTFFSAYSEADFFGKLIFLSLFSLSVICWVVLIHKMQQTRKVKRLGDLFQKQCEKNPEKILHLELQERHPFANVFRAAKEKTLEVLNKNHFFSQEKGSVFLSRSDLELVESYVLTAISAENKALEKNLVILSTITTLAPFLGLLGTVWGILLTFGELNAGASVSSSSVILGGLSTALATTVLGLVIAIPALIAHNLLKNTTRTLHSDMEDFLYRLLSTLELQYRKVEM